MSAEDSKQTKCYGHAQNKLNAMGMLKFAICSYLSWFSHFYCFCTYLLQHLQRKNRNKEKKKQNIK